MGISLIKRVMLHGFLGVAAGVVILHPLSLFIFNIGGHNNMLHLIAPEHLFIAGYFAILGGVTGILNALYVEKNARLYEEIRVLSITDELTSLYNRRYFTTQLKKELERANRYNRFLSVFMIDLNNFKQYNDTRGHQSGDEMLREVAMLLKDSARKPDFVARYGGDEFVIVMPEADKNKALKMADRIQAEVEDRNFKDPLTDKEARFTISFGLATFPTDARDMDKLITKADTMLYKMKREITQ